MAFMLKLFIQVAIIFLNFVVAVGWFVFFNDGENLAQWVSPVFMYKNTKLNLFGVIILSIIVNVCLPIVSVPYWIYKAFTVGRNDKNEC